MKKSILLFGLASLVAFSNYSCQPAEKPAEEITEVVEEVVEEVAAPVWDINFQAANTLEEYDALTANPDMHIVRSQEDLMAYVAANELLTKYIGQDALKGLVSSARFAHGGLQTISYGMLKELNPDLTEEVIPQLMYGLGMSMDLVKTLENHHCSEKISCEKMANAICVTSNCK